MASLQPMVQLEEISYLATHLFAGVKDSIYLNYAIVMSWKSKKIQKVLKMTIIPNLIFLLIYLILQFSWVLTLIFYVPLVITQFLVNSYVLLKSRDSLKNLFDDSRKNIHIMDTMTDIITDSVFCNITLITSTLLYLIFRTIGVLVPVCQVLYALVYSVIIGYTICLNLLIEKGLTFEQRLHFIEEHLVYLIGYGLPLTIGYNTLPLIVYFSIQSILTPLMIINTKQHFQPLKIPGGPIKLITIINQINQKIFQEILILIKKINSWSKSTNEEVRMATE